MTTRRRRTGSESNPLDETDQGVSQHKNTLLDTIPDSSQLFVAPVSWPVRGPVPNSVEAYYKKTDYIASSSDLNINIQPKFFASNATSPSNNSSSFSSNTSVNSFSNFYDAIGQGLINYLNPQDQTKQSINGESTSTDLDSHDTDILLQVSAMACRDRSSEFAGIIRSQQQSRLGLSNGAALTGRASRPIINISQYSNFMKRARLVGRNISSTFAKLEKLTLLARKRSLFDDSQDAEVQELTAIIRHDLCSLTKQLEDLKKSSSSQQSGGGSAHLHKHSANLVGALQTKVATITQKFRDVLEVRTESLKKQAERREQFAGSSAPLLGSSVAPPPGSGRSLLLQDEANARLSSRTPGSNSHVVLDLHGVGGNSSSLEPAHQQQLLLLEEQDSLLQSRAETMRTVEATIVELGTMFTQLAAMVKEQDELVQRIDANVDDAEMNVEAAHSELTKYFRSVSSNRWLMVKAFGIVIVFFIIFIVFMA